MGIIVRQAHTNTLPCEHTFTHTHTPLPQADKLVLGLAKFYGADFNYFFVVACELRLIFTYTSTVIYLYAPLSLSLT